MKKEVLKKLEEKDIKKTVTSFEEYFISQFGNLQETKNPVLGLEKVISNNKVNFKYFYYEKFTSKYIF